MKQCAAVSRFNKLKIDKVNKSLDRKKNQLNLNKQQIARQIVINNFQFLNNWWLVYTFDGTSLSGVKIMHIVRAFLIEL